MKWIVGIGSRYSAGAVALAVVVVLVLVGHARIAQAGPQCGGSGGGNSGGGNSGTSDSGSWSGTWDSSPSPTSYSPYGSPTVVVVEPACKDDSDVVGYRHCKKYGSWARDHRIPRLSFEAGVAVRQFSSLLDSQTGRIVHGADQFYYRVLEPTNPAHSVDTAVMSTMRAGLGLSHGLYTAVELDLGGIAQPAEAETQMMTSSPKGSPTMQQERGYVIDGLASIGFRGTTGLGGLGVEVAGGLRTVSYSFHSSFYACEQGVNITASAPIAEARARGELWVNPWLTAGVTVGTSLLERNAWMGGLYLGLHTRSFGGQR